MAMPQNVIDCSSSVVNPSDPLCERMQSLLSSGLVFCAWRNWAFNPLGTDISQEFQDMIQPAGAAGGDLLGSTYPNPIIAPGVVTSAKMTATGVTPGIYSNATVTVDIAGRVTLIASGAAPVFGASGQVTGAGSNYVVTGSFANVVFGATDPIVVLPASGTYLITAVICGTVTGDGVPEAGVTAKLYNITAAADVASSQRTVSVAMSALSQCSYQLILSNIITVGAASITIRAQRQGGTAASITAVQTSISYIRLA